MKLFRNSLLAATCAMLPVAAHAEDTWEWWPFALDDLTGGETSEVSYTPRLEPPSEKWHVCVLFPHLKDTFWIGTNAGVMQEAARQGVQATLFQAGGYTELNKQLAQFDDCMALGVDAIIISAISEGALRGKIRQAQNQGIVQIGLVNPITDSPIDGAIFADYDMASLVAGDNLQAYLESQGKPDARVINFAGVAGSGWAEAAASGWKMAFEDSGVEVVEDKFGETGKSAQLQLIEDAIQTYDDIDAFVGVGTMAEVAPDALQETGLSDDIAVVPFHMTEGVMDGIMNGTILGAADGPKVVVGAIAMDMAIRALEGEEIPTRLREIPAWITKDFVESADMRPFAAPEGWDPVFNVE
mgnify:CR=1 FL=1